MVRGVGFEPTRLRHQILNLARLPVSPPAQMLKKLIWIKVLIRICVCNYYSACEKQSQLGKYYIHITKQVIDFRKIEAASEKKFLYDFTTGLVKVNGQPMDEHFVSKFYKMMDLIFLTLSA